MTETTMEADASILMSFMFMALGAETPRALKIGLVISEREQ
ncbi:hypothetical protein phiA829_128 [Aeromonas phage phiA8-29]|uniref:Uncharacterized protein n=1 Tax=Aeromonas phage phiA8-29 TaxID=1978922 RepID=A0A1W6DYG6_9CAUD|nr:hypothetical protein HWB15_gp149 [Aeromonas phage phiA8-29]ARK07948.1 hypothetical protein phiA829_128 [Aeromonas phage phiA8-29]